MKKSQSSLLVLVSLVGIFIIAWIFSSFYSFSSSQRAIEETLLSKIMKYLDYVKGYTRNALILAVHAETKNIASLGGQVGGVDVPRNWICNGDVSPSVDDVRFFLSNETINDLNKYIKNFKIFDLPFINVTNSTCVDYDVNEGTVFSGNNDEKFNVGSYGSKANITLESNIVSSRNDVYEEIAQDRFWFMYRKFKEWASETQFINYVSSCTSILCKYACGGFNDRCDADDELLMCAQGAVNKATSELETIFNDQYISCSGNLYCCHGVANPCSPPGPCVDCCTCRIKPAGELCSKTYSSYLKSTQLSQIKLSLSPSGTGCNYWQGNRLDVEADFSCTDRKYLLSVEGDRRLTFSVHATANIAVPEDCPRHSDCMEMPGCEKCKEDFCWCSVDCNPPCP